MVDGIERVSPAITMIRGMITSMANIASVSVAPVAVFLGGAVRHGLKGLPAPASELRSALLLHAPMID
jgi:hypothetical protein